MPGWVFLFCVRMFEGDMFSTYSIVIYFTRQRNDARLPTVKWETVKRERRGRIEINKRKFDFSIVGREGIAREKFR